MTGDGPPVGRYGTPDVVVVPTVGGLDVVGALEGADVAAVERVTDLERWTPDPDARVGCVVASHDPPGVDGLDAVRTVRARIGADVPAVLVLPPRADTRAIERVLGDEVTDYVRAFGSWEDHLLARVRSRMSGDRSTFRELYHNTNEGLLLHDPETAEVLHANDRFRELLGFEPGAEVTLADIMATEAGFTAERAREMVRDSAEDGRQVFEWLDETATGDPLWTEVSLQPLTIGGQRYVMAAVRDISDRKARERDLADTRRRLDETLERVDEAFFGLDDEWRFTYLNEQAAELLEVDHREAVGESIWELFPDAVGTEFQREYEAAMAEQEARSFEASHPPLETWFEIHAYPDDDGLSVFFRDVTERKARERDLELYETIVETVEDGIYAVDSNGRFLMVNEGFCELTGYEREELLGAPATTVHDETISERAESMAAAINAGEETSGTIELDLGRKDGTSVRCECRLHPFDTEDGHGRCGVVRDISERRARERDLELYETVFENVRERLFVLEEDDCVAFATERFAAWLGVDRAALVGTPISAHLSEATVTAVRDGVAAIRDSGREAMTVQSETVADDRWRDVEVAVTLLPASTRGSVLCSVRDVTDRESAERSRDALIKNVPGMVYRYRTDSTGGMAFVSGACLSLTGYDPEELMDGFVSWQGDIVHPGDRDSLQQTLERAVDAHESFTATYRVVSETGRTRWVREYGRPVFGPDGNVGAIEGIVVEVTEEITRERQRKVLNRVLRHNLRNEVQAILGYTDILEDQLDDEEAASFAVRIREAGDSLASLSAMAGYIENTIEADGEGLSVDLEPLLQGVAERRREAHPDADIRVESAAGSVLAGDALAMAVDELVENAVVHNDDPAVTLWTRNTDERVEIHIEDDGDGLPERERAVVTGAREITQLDHGQGLGLWLAKWVVESYGGELDILVDGGTQITLSIPRAD